MEGHFPVQEREILNNHKNKKIKEEEHSSLFLALQTKLESQDCQCRSPYVLSNWIACQSGVRSLHRGDQTLNQGGVGGNTKELSFRNGAAEDLLLGKEKERKKSTFFKKNSTAKGATHPPDSSQVLLTNLEGFIDASSEILLNINLYF